MTRPPRSDTLRFPNSVEEAYLVYDRWDRLNGRYYFRAQVILQTGETLLVTFDSDTNIAVEVTGLRVPERLFSATIIGCHVRERSPYRAAPPN